MPWEERLPLAEIGLVVLVGEERTPKLLQDNGIGMSIPIPGKTDFRLILVNEKGIMKVFGMKRRGEFSYHA
ncbi:MAG: hypothetical protein V3U51_03405 [Thermoplasmata archaeon]